MTEREFREQERNTAMKKRALAKRKKRRRRAIAAIFVLLAVLTAAVISILAVTVFKVESISVSGNERYASEEIINAIGVEEGDSLIFLNDRKLSQKLEKQLPFITNVKVTRELPTTLKLSVEETLEELCFYNSSVFYSANADKKLLSEYITRPEKLTVIVAGGECSYSIGEKFICDDEAKNTVLETILKFGRDSGQNVTIINVSDLYNINFIIDDSLVVELGSTANIERKLQFVPKMSEIMKDDERNVIDLSNWSPENNEAVSYEKNIDNYFIFE